mmetsp:Transcript_46986/g.135362  ORF Transcript_46986/g.135362 Transcript_46986/m.135362 type:complete len:361 (+) Transcript_46986:107-1189(+)
MPGPFGRTGSLWRSKKAAETGKDVATPRPKKDDIAYADAPSACTITLGRSQQAPLYEETLPENAEYCAPSPDHVPVDSVFFRQPSPPKQHRKWRPERSPRDSSVLGTVTSLGKPSKLPLDRHSEPEDIVDDPTPEVRPMTLPDIPACFLCPIGQQLMRDPVVGRDGATYERENIAARDPEWANELRSNEVLKEAIRGYVELRQAAKRQRDHFEASMSDYKRQVGLRVEMGEQHVADLQKQVEALESCGGRSIMHPKLSARSAKSCMLSDTSVNAMGSVPKLMLAARDEGSPICNGTPCPFSAGPAPRSARGPRASPRPMQTPRTACATPRKTGIAGLTNLKAALTPRISQMMTTPRGPRV